MPADEAQLASSTGYIREKAYFATALERGELTLPDSLCRTTDGGTLYAFIQRNKVCVGDSAEIISPRKIGTPLVVRELYDEHGTPVESAPHPSMKFWVRVPFEVTPGDIMRSGD
jgi:putative protease